MAARLVPWKPQSSLTCLPAPWKDSFIALYCLLRVRQDFTGGLC